MGDPVVIPVPSATSPQVPAASAEDHDEREIYLTGHVKTYSTRKGFGFVTSDELQKICGGDIFVYNTHLVGRIGLIAGEKVEFVLFYDPMTLRPQARNVRVLEPAPQPGEPLADTPPSPTADVEKLKAIHAEALKKAQDKGAGGGQGPSNPGRDLHGKFLSSSPGSAGGGQATVQDAAANIRRAQEEAQSKKRHDAQLLQELEWSAQQPEFAPTFYPPPPGWNAQPVKPQPQKTLIPVGSEVTIIDFPVRDINGQRGTVRAYQENSGRYKVEVTDPKKGIQEFLMPREKLRIDSLTLPASADNERRLREKQQAAKEILENAIAGGAARTNPNMNARTAAALDKFDPMTRGLPEKGKYGGKENLGVDPYAVHAAQQKGGKMQHMMMAPQHQTVMGPGGRPMIVAAPQAAQPMFAAKGPGGQPIMIPAHGGKPMMVPAYGPAGAQPQYVPAGAQPQYVKQGGKPGQMILLPGQAVGEKDNPYSKDAFAGGLMGGKVGSSKDPYGQRKGGKPIPVAGPPGTNPAALTTPANQVLSPTEHMNISPQRPGSQSKEQEAFQNIASVDGLRGAGNNSMPDNVSGSENKSPDMEKSHTPKHDRSGSEKPGTPSQPNSTTKSVSPKKNPLEEPPTVEEEGGGRGTWWRVRKDEEFAIVRAGADMSSPEVKRLMAGDWVLQSGNTTRVQPGVIRMPVEEGWVTVHARIIGGPTFLELVPAEEVAEKLNAVPKLEDYGDVPGLKLDERSYPLSFLLRFKLLAEDLDEEHPVRQLQVAKLAESGRGKQKRRGNDHRGEKPERGPHGASRNDVKNMATPERDGEQQAERTTTEEGQQHGKNNWQDAWKSTKKDQDWYANNKEDWSSYNDWEQGGNDWYNSEYKKGGKSATRGANVPEKGKKDDTNGANISPGVPAKNKKEEVIDEAPAVVARARPSAKKPVEYHVDDGEAGSEIKKVEKKEGGTKEETSAEKKTKAPDPTATTDEGQPGACAQQ